MKMILNAFTRQTLKSEPLNFEEVGQNGKFFNLKNLDQSVVEDYNNLHVLRGFKTSTQICVND